MPHTTVNELPVQRAVVTLPRAGVWHIDAEVQTDDASKVTGKVTFRMAGELELVGTAEGDVDGQKAQLRIVGGARGMQKPSTAKFYRDIPARTPINEALAEGGEVLSSTSNAVVDTQLSFWTRPATGNVGDALQNLVDELGATWRMLPSGQVWIGSETWPATTAKDYRISQESHEDGRIDLFDAHGLLPGTTIPVGGKSKRISRVVHMIDPGSVETTIWIEAEDAPPGGALLAAVERLVRKFTRRIDYLATYAARVVAQNANGTLELKPDDPRLPGMSKVPIRYGIPGVSAKISPGARVGVSFMGGSPSKPQATIWESATVTELTIKGTKVVVDASEVSIAGGAAAVARQGDPVYVVLTAAHVSAAQLSPVGVPVGGAIMMGSSKVKSG